jgi:hypothetical protein
MLQGNTPVFVTLIIVMLAISGGFFVAFDKIASLSSALNAANLKIETLEKYGGYRIEVPRETTPTPTSTTPLPTAPTSSISRTIPTAIIFQTSSSEVLPPQVPLTITIESVKRDAPNAVVFQLKVYNGEGKGYAALDPRTLLELLNFEGDNVKATMMSGSFSAIPAKGAVTGTVTIPADPARSSVILQINLPELKFYEFDFERQTYHQAEVG